MVGDLLVVWVGRDHVSYFQPDAKEFIPKAKEEHRHSGERYGYSLRERRGWASRG